MAAGDDRKNLHIIVSGSADTERYQSPQRFGGRKQIPDRNRQQHGGALLGQIDAIKDQAQLARSNQEAIELTDGFGLQVEFASFPDIELAFESLAREKQGIEVLNVRQDESVTYATVFVPDGKLDHFEALIRDYLEEKRDSRGRARDNRKLINTIREIRAASLRALWTDDPAVFPTNDEERFWWEVWLPVRGDRESVSATFRQVAEAQELEFASGTLVFPERTVLLVYGSAAQMSRSVMSLNNIAELRRAKETAEFFDTLPPAEQAEWVEDLLGRATFSAHGAAVPYICLLDTGINNGHPLLAQALAEADLHTVEPAWGTNDQHGHGTAMAGLALAGDLTEILESTNPIEISHRLESVKLLPHDGANGGDGTYHGYLTTEAVARSEITAPWRQRVFGMAVTAKDNRDRGRPSAWSSAIDRLAVDAAGQGETRRLIVLAAGNIQDPSEWAEYPASNETDAVHDPAQAWNALTVGAFTNLIQITEENAGHYQPIADAGGLSPFSTTSMTWQPHWPLKPDVVFEGGNAAMDAFGAVSMPSLSLLTTHHLPTERLLTKANATSAAAALASRMGAQIMSEYPALWPESVRALIVHSAGWTSDMTQKFLPQGQPTKKDYASLVRRCGFGVPNLDHALWSVANSLTLVAEENLHPFHKEKRSLPTLCDMNLHRLPWPLTELEELGDVAVEMRVTLSYFIEPNPSARGVTSRYRYESHGLRFDVKRSLESEADFRARVNAAARDEEEQTPAGGADQGWLLGKKNRHRGSLHSDIWRGSAADLASRGVLAVYPSLGWWKTRPALERYDEAARYSLIVSIRAPEVDVDLYTAVANQVAVPTEIET